MAPKTPAQESIPTLYNLHHAQSFRCLWALEEVRLINPSFKFHVKNYVRSPKPNPELLAVHRLGKAPIMTLESVRPNTAPPNPQLEPGVLTESVLILRYINEEYAGGLWDPEDAESAKRDRFFNAFAVDTLSLKTQFTMLFELIPSMLPFPFNYLIGTLASPLVRHFQSDLDPIFQLMEDALSEEMPWFSGKKIGLADFNSSFAMNICEHRKFFDADRYPKVADWWERCKGREAFKKAIEASDLAGLDFKWFGMKGNLQKK